MEWSFTSKSNDKKKGHIPRKTDVGVKMMHL